ncbi:antitoxin Xre/MbcA/ParS toxin-binding domain-containing protein [Pseudomonas chlororaphis]
MSSSILRPQTGAAAQPLTFQLTHAETGSLRHVDILRLVQAGFALSDVQAMVRSSSLFKAHKLLERIMGKSARTIQRLSNPQNEVRLNPQQSAVVLQYAQGLELAVMVFGSQTLAENWLGRSCKHLSGIVPFEMLNTSVGFKVVVDYLERARLGVYQ